MLIDCPACARSYHIGRDDIGAAGRAVVCPRCQAHWFVDQDGRGLDAGNDLRAAAVSGRVPPIIKARDVTKRGLFARLRPALLGIGAIVCAMVLIGERVHVVRIVPRLERLYAAIGLPVNVRGIAFAQVTTTRLDPTTIAISGEIRNVAPNRIAVPRLAYDIRDAAGVTLASWTERPPTRTLEPGQTLAFTAPPHDSPRDGETIAVHFAP